ncbi:MAG: carbon storage regulator CsrA [Pirellulales bacterium]
MLVLSRKVNEQIVVDGNITITIVDIRGDKVRLGIEAPLHVPVHRGEVHDAIRRAQAESAGDSSSRQGS